VSREIVYDDEVGKVLPLLERTPEQVENLYREREVTADTARDFLIDRIKSDDHFAKRCLTLLATDKLLQNDLVGLYKTFGKSKNSRQE
jgi:hypothetical protein